MTSSIQKNRKILEVLPLRNKKTSFFFNVSRELIELTDPEEIFSFLIKICDQLFPQADDILLFHLQREEGLLSLVCSSKKKNSIIIKEKQGDILDKWILKHNQSLLVEDLMEDFKFDYNKVVAFKERGSRSFVGSPLSIGESILGIMRAESKNPHNFSLDDSRLLRSVCDLGAVVLERAYLFRRIEDLAIKDSLTSLFLKDYFFVRLKEEMNRTRGKKSLGIGMLDIDDFKKINDTYGHIVGDLVLKRLAKIVTDIIGDAGNCICRFGGEEFTFFIVECDKEKLFSLAEKIRKEVEEARLIFRKKSVNFTVSLGGVIYPQDRESIYELMEKIDQLLYKAKREGKNRCCLSG